MTDRDRPEPEILPPRRPYQPARVALPVWTMALAILALVLAIALVFTARMDAPPDVHYAPAEDLESIDVATLERARRAIDIAAYVLTDQPVIEALGRAAKRGVKVRVLVDRGQLEHRPETPALIALQDVAGVALRVKRERVLMHLKAYQVDGRVLREGSANFSADGLRRQDNELVVFESRFAAAAFAATFDRLFAEAGAE